MDTEKIENLETTTTLNEVLRQSTTLVEFHASSWSGRLGDLGASVDVAVANKATPNAFKVVKSLLPGNADLKTVNQAITAARAFVHNSTLPYSRDTYGRKTGPRILPNALFFTFVQEFNALRKGVTKSLDKFILGFDASVTEAEVDLGDKFNREEYPTAESLRALFAIHIDFRAIPVGSDFSALDDNIQKALASNVEKRCEEAVVMAMREAWSRITEVVTRMRDNLNKEVEDGKKPKWKKATVNSVADMCKVMKHLNVTNDPDLESIRLEIEETLVPHTMKELKADDVLAKSVASKADDILSRMAQLQAA